MDDTFLRRVYAARVRDFAGGVQFPAQLSDILAYARAHNTPSDIFNDLTHLRSDQFATLEDLVGAVITQHFGAVASR